MATMGVRALALVVMTCAGAAVAGCGGDEATPAKPPADAGAPKGCGDGEVPLEDGCAPAGVPPEDCPSGFGPDDAGGCVAVLPPAPCEKGKMAVPGQDTCQPVAPCGAGTWG